MKQSIVLFITIVCLTTSQAHAQTVTTLAHDIRGNGAISVTKNGEVLVSEYGEWEGYQGNGTRIFKLAPSGAILDTITDLRSPMGTAMDSKGNLYVNNDNNMQRGQVLKIASDGQRTLHATIEGWPSGMNIDQEDNLYIPNYSKGILHKISVDGKKTILAEDERLLGCTGVDFDTQGNVIVSNFRTAHIYRISPEGNITEIAHIKDITQQGFGIGYITVANDVIYATGIAINTLFKITMDGEITAIAGSGSRASEDGVGKDASFNAPNGIRASNDGSTLYISEYGGSKKLRIVRLE